MKKIKATRYYDQAGAFLWQDEVQLRRLWGVGNEVVMNYEYYTVTAVKVELGVQYVTLIKGTVDKQTVWVLTDEGHCEWFCAEDACLAQDREACTTDNGEGCFDCSNDGKNIIGRRWVVGVYSGLQPAVRDLEQNIHGGKLLATVEHRTKTPEKGVIGYWLHFEEEGEAGSYRYLLAKFTVDFF